MRNHLKKLETIVKVFAFLMAISGVFRLQAAEPVIKQADEDFLREQAQRIVRSAALPAGHYSGKWRNTTLYDVHVPGGNMGYPAYWVRDSVMMLGGDFISAQELEGW